MKRTDRINLHGLINNLIKKLLKKYIFFILLRNNLSFKSSFRHSWPSKKKTFFPLSLKLPTFFYAYLSITESIRAEFQALWKNTGSEVPILEKKMAKFTKMITRAQFVRPKHPNPPLKMRHGMYRQDKIMGIELKFHKKNIQKLLFFQA
jgi:hypothetical protein